MESPKTKEKEKRSLQYAVIHCSFLFAFSLFFHFLFSIIGILIGNFPDFSAVSISTHCKIISGSVELRSSKICELGLFNYKSKRVLYPVERPKFRCRYDYYWASIVQVEYREYSSGQIIQALAESPKEALPLHCRPTFATTWIAKDRFKCIRREEDVKKPENRMICPLRYFSCFSVNDTYDCKYIPGSSKVDIYSDNLFDCMAEKEPSMVEIMKRFAILFRQYASFPFSHKTSAGKMFLEMITGFFLGIPTAFFSVILLRLFWKSKIMLAKLWDKKMYSTGCASNLKRISLFIVYFSSVGLFIVHYGNIIGLSEFFFSSYVGEEFTER